MPALDERQVLRDGMPALDERPGLGVGCLRLTSDRARVTGVMECLRLSSNRSGGVEGCLRWSSSRSGVVTSGGRSGSATGIRRPDLGGVSLPAASECGCCHGGCGPRTCFAGFPGFSLFPGFPASTASTFPEREFRGERWRRRRELEVGLAFRAGKKLFDVRHLQEGARKRKNNTRQPKQNGYRR